MAVQVLCFSRGFRNDLIDVKFASGIKNINFETETLVITCDLSSYLQIPQFILDESFQQKQSCRILCTQPRRLSALSIAERVAAERGESIGQAVGYQIRLESR